MKNILFLAFLLGACLFSNAQQSQSYLVGKVYTKSANAESTNELKFINESTGVDEGKSRILGREMVTKIGFSYKIKGPSLTITYDDGLGIQDYTIDKVNDKLVSTHLKGYVDGKWGVIFYKRKTGS